MLRLARYDFRLALVVGIISILRKTNCQQISFISASAKKCFMDTGYKIRNQHGIYFLTLTVVNWVDIFTRKVYRDIVIDSLRFCQKKKSLNLHAYVIMSNHIHLIASSKTGQLSDFLRDFKKHTSKTILKEIEKGNESRKYWLLNVFKFKATLHQRNEIYQLWTHDNHPIELESNYFIEQKLNYLHDNPVRAGWVDEPEDYVYSSARNYAGKSGLLEVLYLD